MGNLGLSEILLILVIVIIGMVCIILLPYWKIFSKAGFSPALSLLMVIPFVNIIMLYYFAFSEWPALKNNQK